MMNDLGWSDGSEKEQQRRAEVLSNYFNKYAKHYNKNETVGAQADFSEIYSMLGKLQGSHERIIVKLTKEFIDGLNEIKEDSNNGSALVNKTKVQVLESVNEALDSENIIFPSVEEVINGIQIQIAYIFKEGSFKNSENKKRYLFRLLNSLNERFRNLINDRIHLTTLHIVIKKVFNEGYPDNLSLFEKIEERERENIKREVLNDSFELQEDAYWETAYTLYDTKSTWKEVYHEIESLREEAGIVQRYSSFDSFKRAKSRFDKKRVSGIK